MVETLPVFPLPVETLPTMINYRMVVLFFLPYARKCSQRKSRSRTVLIRDLHRDNNYHGLGERVITGGIVRLSFLHCTRRRRNSTYFTRQSLARTRSRHVFTILCSFYYMYMYYIYIFFECVCAQLSFVLLLLLLPTAKAARRWLRYGVNSTTAVYIYVHCNGLQTRETIFVCFFIIIINSLRSPCTTIQHGTRETPRAFWVFWIFFILIAFLFHFPGSDE